MLLLPLNTSLKQRKAAIVQLGRLMGLLATSTEWPGFDSGVTQEEYDGLNRVVESAHTWNGWFTPAEIHKAFAGWAEALSGEAVETWLNGHPEQPEVSRTVAIICAGNIPAVGLHDVLTVLVTGHKALIKLSSDDTILIPALLTQLQKFLPGFEEQWAFATGKLQAFDAVIATGSNNASRYFEYYFSSYPHIIRKGRNSIAILTGEESDAELAGLAADIFDFFGLGCRSISKVYVPAGYDLNRIFGALFAWQSIASHNKYANNYDYNKAVWLLNNEQLLDNGFILLKEDREIASPTGSLYYEYYEDEAMLRSALKEKEHEIQCIVSRKDIPFGRSQRPALWDYADGVNTLEFLRSVASSRPAAV